jgi:predicted acyl esterase
MTDSERDRLDDLKVRLWEHVSPPGLRNEDEERLAEALDVLDTRDAEIAQLREAIAQERAARERAEAETKKWKEVAAREWERARKAETMLAQARQP